MKRTSHATSRFTLILYKSLVGYQNSASRDGLQLNLATFKSIGVGDKVKITDIKVTGYEKIPEYAEGWTGPQATKIDYLGYTMNDSGMFEDDTIDWAYLYDDPGDGVMVGHWFDNYAFDYIENLEDDKYTLEYGDALWIDMPYAQYGEKIQFVYAGEVAGEDNEFALRDGLSLVGNPMPAVVRITDVDVTGYEKVPEYAEGWTGPQATKIDYLGYTMNDSGMFEDDTIDWAYLYDDPGDGTMIGHWFDNYAFDYIENLDGDKYDLQPGEGIWIDNPYAQYGEKISIIFPSPLVDHTEK